MRAHADGSGVMTAMELSPGAEHAQVRDTGPRTATGKPQEGRITQEGAGRDDVMQLVLIKNSPRDLHTDRISTL